MKITYMYEQVDCVIAISSSAFDYHCIRGVASKFTQKKKIPSIRLAKRLCKSLVVEFSGSGRVISQRRINGEITTRKLP